MYGKECVMNVEKNKNKENHNLTTRTPGQRFGLKSTSEGIPKKRWKDLSESLALRTTRCHDDGVLWPVYGSKAGYSCAPTTNNGEVSLKKVIMPLSCPGRTHFPGRRRVPKLLRIIPSIFTQRLIFSRLHL